MSLFSASISHRSFGWQISLLCFVLGLVLAAAAFTATQINRTGFSSNNPALSYGNTVNIEEKKALDSESEIKKLREYGTDLENKLAKGSDAAKTLNQELQDIKFSAGLTDVVGPGVQITLNDAPHPALLPGEQINLGNLIHDVDIANVVNELKASGAEAISVNGQRVVGSTAIRCVGPVVHVNFVPAAAPYVIQAIGDSDTLYNGMNMPNSVLDELRSVNPGMVKMEKRSKLVLPEFSGSNQLRYAKPVVKSKDK